MIKNKIEITLPTIPKRYEQIVTNNKDIISNLIFLTFPFFCLPPLKSLTFII